MNGWEEVCGGGSQWRVWVMTVQGVEADVWQCCLWFGSGSDGRWVGEEEVEEEGEDEEEEGETARRAGVRQQAAGAPLDPNNHNSAASARPAVAAE